MKVEFIRKGIGIAKFCLNNCQRLYLEADVFRPNQDTMDILLNVHYLKLCFNGDDPDSNVLIFHNSEDKYAHNGDIKFTCYLSQVPKVLECVRKNKKVIALMKEIKQRGKSK